MKGITRLIAIFFLLGAVFWLTNLSQWAEGIPGWVQGLAWVGLLIFAPFTEDAAKDRIKESWKEKIAWLNNSLYSFDLLVRLQEPVNVPMASIFAQVEEYLKRGEYRWQIGVRNKNVRQYKIAEPPVTLSVKITPIFSDDFDEDERFNIIEITSLEPQVVPYRERRSSYVERIVSMMYDMGREISASFPNGSQPQILLTVNRLKGRQSSRRPQPPALVDTQSLSGGVTIRQDSTALQVFSPTVGGVLEGLRKDIGQLEPLA